jgi:hypothetical protein
MRYPIFAVAMAVAAVAAVAQAQPVPNAPMPNHQGHMPQVQTPQQVATSMNGPMPTLPGQDAFGAVQEIVRILEADPKTDWSKINLDALREHLIDMNEVTLHADARVERIDGGIRVSVTGAGRTLDAIRRMLPAHADEINGLRGWQARTESLPNGVNLFVTSSDPEQIKMIRGLGFIGVLVTGTHHQTHHLLMAKGEFQH